MNPSNIAQNIREAIEKLIDETGYTEDKILTAYEIEGYLWEELLTIGQQLLTHFFASQHQAEQKHKSIKVEEQSYQYVGPRERNYDSIFGRVRIKRRAYLCAGTGMLHPLDAYLNLPERQYSYRLQEWISEWSTERPYESVISQVERWLGLNLPKKSVQTVVNDHANYHQDYEHELPPLEPDPADKILVVQGDGKGVPMTAAHSPPPNHRKRNTQTASKEATTTAIYTLEPYPRSAEAVIDALLGDTLTSKPEYTHPTPHHKHLAASLKGKTDAIQQLKQQVAHYEHEHIQHRVAICDGDHSLQNRIREYLPDFTLIVDIYHVCGYLRDAAEALFGKDHSHRLDWMRDALRCLFNEELDELLEHLKHQRAHLPAQEAYIIRTTINYLTNQREGLHYQHYLAQGYPIGSGVIEGACGHLIHDRFERSGMRWSPSGAQAMLDVRAIVLNEDWIFFQTLFRHKEHQRLYPYAEVITDSRAGPTMIAA